MLSNILICCACNGVCADSDGRKHELFVLGFLLQRVVSLYEVNCSLFRVSNGTKVRNVDVRYANELASHPGGYALAYNGTYSVHIPDMLCVWNSDEGHAYSEGYISILFRHQLSSTLFSLEIRKDYVIVINNSVVTQLLGFQEKCDH